MGRGEEVLGRALKDFTTREEVIIATKVRTDDELGADELLRTTIPGHQ